MKNKPCRFNRSRLWGLLSGLVLVATLCFTPATVETARAASGDCVANGSTVTCTYEYTGAAQSWTVPSGVTQATFDLLGAQGGSGGGQGGRVTATLAVTPGATYQIRVGGSSASNSGGFNGGGAGGTGNIPGAPGGGASDVRTGGFGLSDRLLVAGGGGGRSSRIGGDCGYPVGGAGQGFEGFAGGGGGGQGFGGFGGSNGSSGSLGQGGNGGSGIRGGGGGGGEGGYGGGGGGSSYANPAATSVNYQNGVRTGNGLIIITFADTIAPREHANEPAHERCRCAACRYQRPARPGHFRAEPTALPAHHH